jgi:hypothetical protein
MSGSYLHILMIYNTVLYQCALEQDLSLWQAGDKTEVGEKGVTLRYDSSYTPRT